MELNRKILTEKSELFMKRLLPLLLLLATGCVSRTPLGDCIGVMDDKKPDLVYKVSERNVILGVVFVETIVVPLIVALDELSCPVAKR